MLYSKSTNGFYAREIHGDNIPADSVEITADLHVAMLEGQANGKRITADANGFPVLTDQPTPTTEELASLVRAKRDGKIQETNWLVERHQEQLSAGIETTITDAEYRALLTYRQALRDVPAQAGFPRDITWPTAP